MMACENWTAEQVAASRLCDGIWSDLRRLERAADAPTRRMAATGIKMRADGLREMFGADAAGVLARYSAGYLGARLELASVESAAEAAMKGGGAARGGGRGPPVTACARRHEALEELEAVQGRW